MFGVYIGAMDCIKKLHTDGYSLMNFNVKKAPILHNWSKMSLNELHTKFDKKRARDDEEYADMPELGSDRSDEEHNEMMTNRTDAQPCACKVSAELRAPKAKKTKGEKK